MRDIVIVGNWKMNKDLNEAKDFFEKLNQLLKENAAKIDANVKYGVATSFVYLGEVAKLAGDNFIVAAQNMSDKDSGAFTGETSSSMLKSVGVNSVVLGHSERREYYGETDEIVNAKTHKALEANLLPIVCVGETLEQYEAGNTKAIVQAQIEKSLKGIKDYSKIVIAYEPIWAIGTGKTATAQDAQNVCKFIRGITSEDVIIQYGGSVKPENVKELLEQEDIDGALVGGASLDPLSFVKLLTKGA